MATRPTTQAQHAKVTHEDGIVVIDLDVAYLELTPASARTMAQLLVKHASRIEALAEGAKPKHIVIMELDS